MYEVKAPESLPGDLHSKYLQHSGRSACRWSTGAPQPWVFLTGCLSRSLEGGGRVMDPPRSACYLLHAGNRATAEQRYTDLSLAQPGLHSTTQQEELPLPAMGCETGLKLDWNDSRGKGMETNPCSTQHCLFPALSALLHIVHSTRHYLTAAHH